MSFKEKKDIVQSNDGTQFPFDMKAMTQASKVFQKMIEHVNSEDEETSSNIDGSEEDKIIIPLPINSFYLKLILKWVDYYREPIGDLIDVKLESKNSIFISKWDFEFIKHLTVDQIIKLENASQFLELESLIRLCQRRLCIKLLFCKQPKIRRIMNVYDDFTNEQENAVRRENEWYEDLEGMKF